MIRSVAAAFLLAVAVFSVLPRTLFHHCEQGSSWGVPHSAQGVVHADTHCQICEAPAPIMDGVSSCFFQAEERMVGVVGEFFHSSVVRIASGVTRLRGPPMAG